jgi:putative hydrolase of the HAD superfamily
LKYDFIFFDAAETLFTTRGSVGEIYADIARNYGSQASADDIQIAFFRQFQNSGPLRPESEKDWWKEVVRNVFSEVGMVSNFDGFFENVYEQFRDGRGWKLFPETLPVLEELRRRRYKLGIISNFDSRIYSVLKSLEILSFFDSIIISSETGFAKPDSEIFKAAIRNAAVPASRTLYVGDSLSNDVIPGAAAGLHAILIDRNQTQRVRKAVKVIQNLWQIPNEILTECS